MASVDPRGQLDGASPSNWEDGRAPIDRAGIGLLAAGHFVIDASVGAVAVMLPVFTAAFALSDLAASMILGASLLASSAVQPLFGLLADRRASPAFLWGGVLVGALGLALSGLASGYAGILACIVGSGLGIAAFHPEAARVANRMSRGRPATGLAWFMVGGNAGFAAGPLIAALAIPWLDTRATLVFLVPGVGMLSFAKDKATARIAGAFYVNAINVMKGASTVSDYQGLPEQEAFEIEYWLLEEAKLQRMPKPKSLAGRVAFVTGGAGGIGRATAERLMVQGACVVLADIDAGALADAMTDFWSMPNIAA